MLFGGSKYEEKILNDAFRYAEKNDMRLIYGALVGGISKGLQNFDSDYDTRFLYIKNDFPDVIYFPQDHKESALIKRYYPDEDELYEWIPFWEATSFFQFLHKPMLDKRLSYGLYGVVLWTMMSPYTWDPYGLQNKIVPYINSFFNKEYAIRYYLEQLNNHLTMGNEKEILIKKYLYALHAACSLEWVMTYNSMPPVYLKTLSMGIKNGAVKLEIDNLIESMKKQAAKLDNTNGEMVKLHRSHRSILTQRIDVVEEYVNNIMILGQKTLKSCVEQEKEEVLSCIQNIYKLIKNSLNETKLEGM